MTDDHTKRTKAILTSITNCTTVACIFREHYAAKCDYGIPLKTVADNGPQFLLMFFVVVCSTIGVNNITTTEWHPQTSSQAERFNSTVNWRLRHSLCKNQTEWDTYPLPVTYTYNIQVRRYIEVYAFRLVHTRTSPRLATILPSHVPVSSDDDMVS